MSFIQLLNGDLASGVLSIAADRNQDLVSEISLLQWDADELAENKWVEDRRFPNHLSDALLYAWREARHHNLTGEREGPKPGTQAWLDAQEKKLLDARLASMGPKEGHWLDDVFK